MNSNERFVQFLQAAKSLESDDRWALCMAWMIEQLEMNRQALETAQVPHLFTVQGKVQALRETLAYLTNPGHFLRLLQEEGKARVHHGEETTGVAGLQGDD